VSYLYKTSKRHGSHCLIPDALAYEDPSYMAAMQSAFPGPDGLDGYPGLHHPPPHHQYPGYGPPPLLHVQEGQYLVPQGPYSPSGAPDAKDYSSLMPYHQDSWNNNNAGGRQSPSAYDCY